MEKETALRIIVIGGGIAGVAAAEAARKTSSNAEIRLISSECEQPYYRLNLVKYLGKEIEKEALRMYPEEWYGERRIQLLCSKKVEKIDRKEKCVILSDGECLAYDRLILANGAQPFLPPMKGNDLKNVMTVRTIGDVDHVLAQLERIDHCVCIGGGILGLEVAGAIAEHGKKVTVLENSSWLMPRQLNKRAADKLKGYLAGIGIEVLEDSKIEEIVGTERCEGVRLVGGAYLPSELVIITAGVRPNLGLAMEAGLECKSGVLVDDRMATSDESIFAAGDVTEHKGVLYGLWSVAMLQGKAAGQSAAGGEGKFAGIPRTNVLKVLGVDMLSVGEMKALDESYYQHEVETEELYVSLIMKDEKIVGAIVYGDKALSVKVKMAVDRGVLFPKAEYPDGEAIIAKLKG